jgi:hypothetical protein
MQTEKKTITKKNLYNYLKSASVPNKTDFLFDKTGLKLISKN